MSWKDCDVMKQEALEETVVDSVHKCIPAFKGYVIDCTLSQSLKTSNIYWESTVMFFMIFFILFYLVKYTITISTFDWVNLRKLLPHLHHSRNALLNNTHQMTSSDSVWQGQEVFQEVFWNKKIKSWQSNATSGYPLQALESILSEQLHLHIPCRDSVMFINRLLIGRHLMLHKILV